MPCRDLPPLPAYGDVSGSMFELQRAGGLGAGGGLDERHRAAVERFITRMCKYAAFIGISQAELVEAVALAGRHPILPEDAAAERASGYMQEERILRWTDVSPIYRR